MQKTYVVIPNWNGARDLPSCLNSLVAQIKPENIIVVDNASSDNSVKLLEREYPKVVIWRNKKNEGFAGGVNAGMRIAIERGGEYIALINNDAVADKSWLKELASHLDNNPNIGITTGKIIAGTGGGLDSTGEQYSIWGLPFPRGRDESADKYTKNEMVFGASGGASLYRTKMLKEIGLFDEDFFAYYEDVDLSFRAQLAGWKVSYVPKAIAHHQIGATGGKIKGLYTYQTLKNLPLLLWKNVPWALMPKVWPRLVLAWSGILVSAILRGQFAAIFKGVVVGTVLWPKKMIERHEIQKNRKVTPAYIDSIMVHDLPPEAYRLRSLRSHLGRMIGKVQQ